MKTFFSFILAGSALFATGLSAEEVAQGKTPERENSFNAMEEGKDAVAQAEGEEQGMIYLSVNCVDPDKEEL